MWSLLCSEKFRHSLQNAMLDELRFLTENLQKQMLVFWCSLYSMWTTASDPIQKWCLNSVKKIKCKCIRRMRINGRRKTIADSKHIQTGIQTIFDKFSEDMYKWVNIGNALKYFVQIIAFVFKSKIILKHMQKQCVTWSGQIQENIVMIRPTQIRFYESISKMIIFDINN
ncbi:Hypothetical_protein [Hexamita inflata]|uniref:Hypothetical_protein n=1 Tax=Hexamita inflata TaxID=28002 RepID=A0ABP1LLF0_9EUKA